MKKRGARMLGERICLLRRQRGWNQAELAKHLCVSPSTVGMYEQGRREPSLKGAVALSRAFGVSVDYLLTGTPLTEADGICMARAVEGALPAAEERGRLSKEELAALFAAMLTEA